VCDLVIARGVTIEACPTSNVHTGIIASVGAHPLPRWLELGVRACVCADNTLLSATTAAEELQRVAQIEGMNEAKLTAVIAHGHAGAFRRG
jgi:adenosine deaminase